LLDGNMAGVVPACRDTILIGVRKLRGNACPLQSKRAAQAYEAAADDQS
jgi:hypothetical protein